MKDLKELRGHFQRYQHTYLQQMEQTTWRCEQLPIASELWFERLCGTLELLKSKQHNCFFIGNGASSAIANHAATDFTKNAKIRSFSFSDSALVTCLSNDYGHEQAMQEWLKAYMREGDLLVAISSSGRSANILTAVQYVLNQLPTSRVVALSGFTPGNPLRALGHFDLHVPIEHYGVVESLHAFYLHALLDIFVLTT